MRNSEEGYHNRPSLENATNVAGGCALTIIVMCAAVFLYQELYPPVLQKFTDFLASIPVPSWY